MTHRTLLQFFALSFGISWGILALFMLLPEHTENWFGKMGYTNPLFILAVYAPAIAAIGLVVQHHGLRGLWHFAQRFGLWRMPMSWWLLLVAGVPLVFYAGAAMKGSDSAPFPFTPWWAVMPAMLTTLLIGPVEEIGWRGLALPLLQRHLTPFMAGLGLGLAWAVWHVPAFFLSGTPQSNWSLPGFLLGCVALSLILTPMFNASGGSLLVAALFHFQVNGPAWPDAQPWDSLIFALLAVVMVVFKREHYFSRIHAANEILRPTANHAEVRRSRDAQVEESV